MHFSKAPAPEPSARCGAGQIKKLLGVKIFWFLLIVLITLVFWFPTKDIPYWWDSAGYIIHAAKYYIDINFSSIFLPAEREITAFAHPPFFTLGLALIWKIFGESLLSSHLFYFIFVLLSAIFVYLLGRRVANNFSGFAAALLLLFTPVFLAQVGIIYTEIPVTAFALMTVYFFLNKKFWWYFLSAFLMLFIKETSALIILAILSTIFIQFIIKSVRKRKFYFKKCVKKLFFYSLPVLPLIGWFVRNKIATGWLFVVPHYGPGMAERALSLAKLPFVFKFFFLEQYRFLITFAILGLLVFCLINKKRRGAMGMPHIIVFSFIVVFVPLFFSVVDFLHRYIIFGLPFLYLLFFSLIRLAFRKEIIYAILFYAILILPPLFHSDWNNNRRISNWHFPPLEENLEYLDIIKIGKYTSGFLEQYYSEAAIYTEFPTNYMLSQPYQHYVQKPLNVRNCKDYKEGDEVNIVVSHYFSPNQAYCWSIIKELQLYNLITFSENGKSIAIYKK